MYSKESFNHKKTSAGKASFRVYNNNNYNQAKVGESAIVKACLDSVVCQTADPSRLK